MKFEQLLDMALAFHGHKCPAMPLGLRAGLAAMEALGVERAQAHELHIIAETGKGHAGGCFLDGLMAATGCTYGKSNIEKLYYNKFAFTLIDTETNRAVRVWLKPEFVENMLKSPFVQLRSKGIKPQDIDPEILAPLLDNVLSMPYEKFLNIGEVKPYEWQKGKGCFEVERCEICGEAVFTNKLYEVDGKKVCGGCKEQ